MHNLTMHGPRRDRVGSRMPHMHEMTRSGSPAAIVRSCRSPAGACLSGGPTLLSGPPVSRRANRSCPGPRSPGGPTAPVRALGPPAGQPLRPSRCPPLKTDGDATTMRHRDPGPGDGARKQILQKGGVRTPRPRAIRYISRFRQRPEIRELTRSYLPVVERRDGSRPARWAGFAPVRAAVDRSSRPRTRAFRRVLGSENGPGDKKKPARWGRAGSVLLGRRCCYEVRRAMKDGPRT